MRVDKIKLLILQNALAAIRGRMTPQVMNGNVNYKIAVDILGDVIDDLKIWRNNDATIEELNYSCSAIREARELIDDETIDRDVLAAYTSLVDILHEVEEAHNED